MKLLYLFILIGFFNVTAQTYIVDKPNVRKFTPTPKVEKQRWEYLQVWDAYNKEGYGSTLYFFNLDLEEPLFYMAMYHRCESYDMVGKIWERQQKLALKYDTRKITELKSYTSYELENMHTIAFIRLNGKLNFGKK